MPEVDNFLQHFFVFYIELLPILGEDLEISYPNSSFVLDLYWLNITSWRRSMYLWFGFSEKRYRYSEV